MASPSWTAERRRRALAVEFCQLVLLQAPVARSGRSRSGGRPSLGGCMDESKNAAKSGRGQPGGSTQRIWSTHRGELRDGTASAAADYALTVQAAARDAVRAALAHGPNTPDAATAVRHLVERLGEQHGPQFVQDRTAKWMVELAEATTAIAAQVWPRPPR